MGELIIKFDLVILEVKVKFVLILVVIFNMDEIVNFEKCLGLVIVGEIVVLILIK